MADSDNLMGPTAAVAVAAAIFSPRVRGILRSGAVQGLAGVLVAGDAISAFAQGVGRGLQVEASPRADASSAEVAQEAARAAQEAAEIARAAAEAAQKTATPPAKARKRPTKSAAKSATKPAASAKAARSEP